MKKSIAEVLQFLDEKAPRSTAESWDNTGLLLGDPKSETPGAIISIDLTHESIEAAKAKGYKLIVNHHPCIFPKQRGLSKVVAGSVVYKALEAGISVIASHTCFDRSALEVPERVAEALGVTPMGRLFDSDGEDLYKLSVFIPETHFEAVRTALFQAGAGSIGNYDQCGFYSKGTGSFRGGAGSNPYLGKTGALEEVPELRFETLFSKGLKPQVLEALKASHPYEEVAFDLIPVDQTPSAKGLVSGLGYGFWGDFKEPKPFPELLQDVKKGFETQGLWMTGNPENLKTVKRIGFVAGKGSSFIGSARAVGCDLFITGETGYHDARSAGDSSMRSMHVIELGHRESERFFLRVMSEWLGKSKSGLGLETIEQNLPTQHRI
jgi:dinuclear metal center YbgI/SA1388 family protein